MIQQSIIELFSNGGSFSQRPLKADLAAARLVRRGIDRGPVGHESRPRPRPMARAAPSQSRKSRVSFAGRPSVSSWRSRRRETRSATESSSKNQVQSTPYIYPMNSDLLYDSSINTPHTCENHTHPCALTTCYCGAHRVAAGT